MSLSSKVNYSLEALSGITVGNINITGNIFQNNNPYIASQWTSTSGNALSYTSGNVIISSGSLLVSSLTTGNINFTGTLSQNGSPYIGSQWTGTSGTLYYGTAGSSQVGINTTSPGATLDVSGTGRITTSLTTGALFSTNQTSTNIVGTRISAANINVSGTLTVVNITSTNLIDTTISTGTLVGTSVSVANLSASSSTLANSFVSGGLGIGTTNPNTSYNLDVAGSIRSGLRLDIGGSQPIYNGNTLGRLFITGSQNSVPNGPNIVITTAQDAFPTYNFLTYGHDSAWTMYDMYFDGSSFRNSATNTAFMMVKENSTLKWNYNTTGFSAGAAATVTTSICIGSGGNVGLGGQVTPIYTLDVSGGARIISGITAGSSTFTSVSAGNSQFTGLSAGNINFTGNLFQNGSAYIGSQWVGTSGSIYYGTVGSSLVGINTTSPAFTLDVTGSGDFSTFVTSGALYSTNQTSTNIVANSLSSGTLVGTTLSTANIYSSLGTITNMVHTNLSSGTLSGTSATVINLINTNTTTSNIKLNDNSAITIDAAADSRLALVKKSGTAFGAIATNNATDMYFQASNSVIAGNPSANTYTTLMSLSTRGNLTITGTTNTVALSTGTLYSTNQTSNNIVATTSLSSGTLVGTTLSTANIYGSLGTITNMVHTNLSSGTLSGTSGTLGNFVATSSTITNLNVPGTLTVVNITSTNLVETNITASTILVTGGSLKATFNSNTIGSLVTTGGNVGIGTNAPTSLLHLKNAGSITLLIEADSDNVNENDNPTIRLTQDNGGTGVNIGLNANNATYIDFNKGSFTSGTSFLISDNDTPRLVVSSSTGNVGIGTTSPAFTLDVNGTIDAITYTGANLAITSATVGTMIANNSLSIGGISSFFTGSFSANNNVSSATNVTGLLFPSASVRSFLATLTINVSKAGGNLNEMVTLEGIQRDSGWSLFDTSLGEDTGLVFTIDSTGQVQYTSINHISWTSTTVRFEGHYYTISGTYIPTALPTTGNVAITGDLSISSTKDATNTSSGALTVLGGAGVSKSLLVGQNLNVGGVSNTFTGSFAAANNVAAATNVTGFLVPTATFSSFTASVNVRLLTTTTTLNAQYLFEATQTTSGWLLNDTAMGDSVDITFTITSAGQIQYTSTNVANWQSTTINYSVTAISISTGFTAVLPTSGSVTISGNLTIDSTTDSSSTSSASLVLAGGAGINKSLLVGGNFNIGGVTTQFAGTFSAANGASGANFTGLSFPNATIRSFSCTISIRVVSNVNYNTQHTIDGIQTATGGWQISDSQIGDASGITFAINSSGQITYTSPTFTSWTSTTMHYNAVAYNISSSYTPIPMPTGGSSSVAGSLVIQGTDPASSTSSGSLSVSGGVNIQKNLIVTDGITASTLLLTSNVNISNSSNNYSATSGGFGLTNDVVMSANQLYFTASGAAKPTLNSRDVGSKIVLYPTIGANTGDYSIGIESSNMWLQVPTINTGYKFYQGTTSSMVIATGGNVGIGTTSPSTPLHIQSSLTSANTLISVLGNGAGTIDNRFRLVTQRGRDESGLNSMVAKIGLTFNNTTGNSFINFYRGGSAIGGFITLSTNDDTERMIITAGGNVGIGTTAPASPLTVNGNIAITPPDAGSNMGVQFFRSGIADWYMYNPSGSSNLRFYNSADHMTLTASGNVGVGTIAPVYKLEVSQDNTGSYPGDNTTGQIIISGATDSTKRFGFQLDTVRNFGHIQVVRAGDTAYPLILNGQGGNVGIATTAPAYTLDINGNLRAIGNAFLTSTTTIFNTVNTYSLTSGALNVTGDIVLSGGSELMFTQTGVAVPTMNGRSAGTKVVLYPTSSAGNGDYAVGIEANNMWFQVPNSNNGYKFYQGTTSSMVIATGNVGIGTTAPAHKLDVVGTIDATTYTGANIMVSGSIGSLGSIDAGSQFLGQPNDNATAPSFSWTGDTNTGMYRPLADTLGFVTNGVERMRVTTGGNVGIGTTSPAYNLDMVGTIRAASGTTASVIINSDTGNGQIELYGTGGAYIDFKNNSNDDYDSRIYFTGSNNSLNFYMSTGNTVGMSLTSAGTLLISGDIGAFASISDARLKTNVENITPEVALDTVKTLRPVTFNWKDDIFNQARRGEFDSGFIAQEVEEVIPHAVGEYTTIDYQNTYKNMRHERIIPYLVGSIQKLEGIITELNTRIEYLESK